MSSSAYSKLIRGVQIDFRTKSILNKMNRFDSKTGNPIIVEEESLQITAECQGSKITLPEETLLYSESNKRDDKTYWMNRRERYRIYEWLHSFGIGDPERGDESKENLEMFDDGAIIGVLIAKGNSYKNQCVEVEEKVVANLQNRIDKLLSEMFQFQLKSYTISTFLLTDLS